ncbi:endonuclease/exonuclease/phosphatase family protein [Novosphingobium sp. P6W]|uniref:endonuclease/exonuclease/phosphatase family protein n=1 Tax=Novosphingobium sp. P6W TaxID=1609758 RepID=UPI0005C2D3C1|nr:endonuclease/exonuclease/phosphatase family protein [Novosphingobium sp. P6W]AXB79502.1 endonuclease [Novosphingobium sp. P6W]KIS34255.1 endonuclease [Novosphingobium sp. P6W]
MKRLQMLAFATAAMVATLNPSLPSPAAVLPPAPALAPVPHVAAANGLSVMTYNVEGLPFPLAYGRSARLAEIGERLGALRRAGRQPKVVLLQEAFIPQAKAIAAAAGYPYAVIGPQTADAAKDAPALDEAFTAQASWLKGEGLGKWVDSGLVILSDYPIVQTRRMAFPADMCAGFDCLAAKGVLLAWIKVPGKDHPVAIADTHLNARKASGVAITRADAAYAMQVAAARGFIRTQVPRSADLVFGGDFNIGHDRTRIATQAALGGIVADASEATRITDLGSINEPIAADRAAILARAKDKQYFRAGTGGKLRLQSLEVPFGSANGGAALSDHLGYVAHYAF